MKTLWKTIAMGLCLSVTISSAPAHAVANPAAIDWDAAPAAFVSSLYVGVLGRAPESGAVVTTWAAQVTSNPSSRLQVMQRFVSSPEYRRAFGDGTGRWGVHYQIQGNTVRWKASTSPNGWYTQRSGLSVNYARALVGYYQTFNNRR